MSEASPQFKEQLKKAFARMQVGDCYTFRRTFTDGDVSTFCGVTGDFNPYHLDETFAHESWYGRRTIPGLLTASMLTHIGGMLGFIATDMRFEFVAAVYVGDTINCTWTVTEKDEERRRVSGPATATNEHGEQVLRGWVSGFPSLIRLQKDGRE